VHAEPELEADAELGADAAVPRGKALEEIETGEHGPVRIVLVRARVAEVHERAVAEVLGDGPAPCVHHARHVLVVRRHEVAEPLRIEPLGERGRADHVDEHHRQLAVLALGESRHRLARPALGTEPDAFRDLGVAARAAHHGDRIPRSGRPLSAVYRPRGPLLREVRASVDVEVGAGPVRYAATRMSSARLPPMIRAWSALGRPAMSST
jgi:hypothetical protein